MMKMWLKMVIYLILGLICAGCVNQNGQYMALASACVEVAPDSAMSILGKVGNIEKDYRIVINGSLAVNDTDTTKYTFAFEH